MLHENFAYAYLYFIHDRDNVLFQIHSLKMYFNSNIKNLRNLLQIFIITTMIIFEYPLMDMNNIWKKSMEFIVSAFNTLIFITHKLYLLHLTIINPFQWAINTMFWGISFNVMFENDIWVLQMNHINLYSFTIKFALEFHF